MSQNYWLIILFVATMVCNGNCRPLEVDLTDVHPVYRAVKQLETTPNSSFRPLFLPAIAEVAVQNAKSPQSKVDIESIATVARASSDGPSAPSQAAFGHLMDTVSQMVDSDIRTPPRLKEILKEKNTDRRDVMGEMYRPMPVKFVYEDEVNSERVPTFMPTDTSEGKASGAHMKVGMNEGVKGVAIPVVMDEDDTTEKTLQKIPEVTKPAKKNGVSRPQPTTTPSSGLSTWILLSDNREVTTLSPKKSQNDKKKTNGTVATTKKPAKTQPTTLKPTTAFKKVTTKMTNTGNKKTEMDGPSTSALEALVKTQKKGLTTTASPLTTKTKAGDQKTGVQKRPTTTDSKKKLSEKKDGAVDVKTSPTAQTLPAHFFITTNDTGVSTTEPYEAQSATENPVEGTTKKKKTSLKKKKKNKKKKKPETGVEPKIPTPVGSQIYNFLSREIVPTVGLGLIGVALTAGLASFLGYNPFVSPPVSLRRTYEVNHGYSPSNYYSYNTDYSDGGQSEEVLLREVLSGMPEESRYGLTHGGDAAYSDQYNRKDQTYDGSKSPVYSGQTSGSMYDGGKESGNYDSGYSQDYSSYSTMYDSSDNNYSSDYKEKYPVYTRETGTSFVYPETTGMTSAAKTSDQLSKSDKYSAKTGEALDKQPEAAYRVGADETSNQYRNSEAMNNQNNWHRIGTPMESMEPTKQYPRLEPGPRSLDLTKESAKVDHKARTKRDADTNIQKIERKRTKKQNDAENEVDFDEALNHSKPDQVPVELPETTQTPQQTPETTTTFTEMKKSSSSATTMTPTTVASAEDMDKGSVTTEEKKDDVDDYTTEPYLTDDAGTGVVSSTASVLDILKRLAQFKLRLGLNFLRSTTDMFSRYLEVIQRKVDESFTNTTTVQYNRMNPWHRVFNPAENSVRRKRSALSENPLLTPLLTTNPGKPNLRFAKSTTKKDLKVSDKMFHHKKTVPKKYEPKTKM